MSSLTIRNLDPAVKARLRVRAAQHGRSMEEEARRIIGGALAVTPEAASGQHWVDELRAVFAPLGGLPELEPLPPDYPVDPFADKR
jgi:plasmid stability protein